MMTSRVLQWRTEAFILISWHCYLGVAFPLPVAKDQQLCRQEGSEVDRTFIGKGVVKHIESSFTSHTCIWTQSLCIFQQE